VVFDAVIFDLDGTLVSHTQDMAAVYEAAFEQVDVPSFGDPPALWAALDGPPDPRDEVGYLGAGFARLAAQHDRRGTPRQRSGAFRMVNSNRAPPSCPSVTVLSQP
jgi:putative hydrolase of the HAD superfamily